MNSYALFLRGINLVKYNRIRMAELRQVLEDAGFGECQTHLQSGNVLLESDEGPDAVALKVEAALERHGLKNVSVVAIPWERLNELVKQVEWPEHDPKQHRPIAIFLRDLAPRASDLIGEQGAITLLRAEPEGLFGLVQLGQLHAFDVKRTIEKPLGTRATVRFWSVVENWVAKTPPRP